MFTVYSDNDRGSTLISNLFIDKYMRDANDAQLKVYLYLLRMMNAGRTTSIPDMADQFNHTERDVMRSLRYWERRGLISLEYSAAGELMSLRMISPRPDADKQTFPVPFRGGAGYAGDRDDSDDYEENTRPAPAVPRLQAMAIPSQHPAPGQSAAAPQFSAPGPNPAMPQFSAPAQAPDRAVSSGGDASEDSSAGGEDSAGQGDKTVMDEELGTTEVLARAQLLAAGYDYDGAIALLESVSDQDSSVLDAIEDCKNQKDRCVAVDVTRIPHVFFHSLINDDRAFNADLVGADRVRQNNAAMTTTAEFDAMIQAMYDAGYVMVGLDDMCIKTPDENGVVHIAKNDSLMLPPEKKAFVLSIDDLSYYHSYGIGTQGYATRMLVDENGKPKCEYTNEEGVTSIGDYDVVPRIDTFIEQHPDFSYRGARGTVAMTGYNGVFGYRTNDYYKDINDPHLDPDQIQWLQEHPDFNWE